MKYSLCILELKWPFIHPDMCVLLQTLILYSHGLHPSYPSEHQHPQDHGGPFGKHVVPCWLPSPWKCAWQVLLCLITVIRVNGYIMVFTEIIEFRELDTAALWLDQRELHIIRSARRTTCITTAKPV